MGKKDVKKKEQKGEKEKGRPKGTKKSTKEDAEKPYYDIGTILTTRIFTGRSTYYHFYKVIEHTKSKAPKVRSLEKESVPEFGTEREVRPTSITRPDVKIMRFYPKVKQYFTPTDGEWTRVARGISLVRTNIYDSTMTYKETDHLD